MERRIVYDSDAAQPGRCPTCGKRRDRCDCDAPRAARPQAGGKPGAPTRLPRDGVVRLMRDRKSRGGKTVTIIAGLPGGAAELERLASDLKRLCGTGGTLRGDTVEIHGDLRDRLKLELEKRGYTVKIAGG